MSKQLNIATSTMGTTTREETCKFCNRVMPANTRACVDGDGWMHFDCMLEAVEAESKASDA